jgi:hypothetical protein
MAMDEAIIVKPLTGRREAVLLLAVVVLVCLVVGAYGFVQPARNAEPKLLDWQVSAFADLGRADQAIHSALRPALEEVYWTYKADGAWPTPEALAEYLLPPFYRDHFWEDSGRVDWRLISNAAVGAADQGAVFYLGTGGVAADQSAYLVVINHAHLNTTDSNQFDIWVHSDAAVSAPSGIKQQSLILEGWRMVVPYRGAEELARIGG